LIALLVESLGGFMHQDRKPKLPVADDLTAISQLSGLGQIATSAIAAAIVPQPWATSNSPRQGLTRGPGGSVRPA